MEQQQNRPPVIVVAGTSSGVGKTSIAVGLMAALRENGLRVQAFKVGPDFIDPMHHERATGRPSINLDGWMLTKEQVLATFDRHMVDADIAIVEGVMGLFDGRDGTTEDGSTAQIAKWLNAPVVLIIDCSAIARSAAAVVKGYQEFDPDLRLKALIFNKVGGEAHTKWLAEAISSSGLALDVLGGIPKEDSIAIQERYLGLHLPHEPTMPQNLVSNLATLVRNNLDLDTLLHLAACYSFENNGKQQLIEQQHDVNSSMTRLISPREHALAAAVVPIIPTSTASVQGSELFEDALEGSILGEGSIAGDDEVGSSKHHHHHLNHHHSNSHNSSPPAPRSPPPMSPSSKGVPTTAAAAVGGGSSSVHASPVKEPPTSGSSPDDEEDDEDEVATEQGDGIQNNASSATMMMKADEHHNGGGGGGKKKRKKKKRKQQQQQRNDVDEQQQRVVDDIAMDTTELPPADQATTPVMKRNASSNSIKNTMHRSPSAPLSNSPIGPPPPGPPVRIAVARDAAFCFYYYDNLALLREAGAELIPFSPLTDPLPPGVAGVYLGGGYPERHAAELADNKLLRAGLYAFAKAGGVIYAECGGLLFLSQSLQPRGEPPQPMVGVFPFRAILPPGKYTMGYIEVETTAHCPLFPAGRTVRGHVHHCSELVEEHHIAGVGHGPENDGRWKTGYLLRPQAPGAPQDTPEGFSSERVLASYVHLHFGGCPDMAVALVDRCRGVDVGAVAAAVAAAEEQAEMLEGSCVHITPPTSVHRGSIGGMTGVRSSPDFSTRIADLNQLHNAQLHNRPTNVYPGTTRQARSMDLSRQYGPPPHQLLPHHGYGSGSGRSHTSPAASLNKVLSSNSLTGFYQGHNPLPPPQGIHPPGVQHHHANAIHHHHPDYASQMSESPCQLSPRSGVVPAESAFFYQSGAVQQQLLQQQQQAYHHHNQQQVNGGSFQDFDALNPAAMQAGIYHPQQHNPAFAGGLNGSPPKAGLYQQQVGRSGSWAQLGAAAAAQSLPAGPRHVRTASGASSIPGLNLAGHNQGVSPPGSVAGAPYFGGGGGPNGTPYNQQQLQLTRQRSASARSTTSSRFGGKALDLQNVVVPPLLPAVSFAASGSATPHNWRHNYPPSDKVVSLGPGATEIAFALGLGKRVVAVSDDCDYPQEVSQRAKVAVHYLPRRDDSAHVESDLESDAAATAAAHPSVAGHGPGRGSTSKLNTLGGGLQGGSSTMLTPRTAATSSDLNEEDFMETPVSGHTPTHSMNSGPSYRGGGHHHNNGGGNHHANSGKHHHQGTLVVDEQVLARERPGLIIYEDEAPSLSGCLEDTPLGSAVLDAVVSVGLQQSCRVVCIRRATLGDVFNSMLTVGEAAGVAEEAARTVDRLRGRLRRVAAEVAVVGTRPKVLVLTSLRPLKTVGLWVPDMTVLGGATDGLQQPGDCGIELTWEQIVNYAPDVLIIADIRNGSTKKVFTDLCNIASNPGWWLLPAVKTSSVYLCEKSLFCRAGPRLVDGVESVARMVHGDLASICCPARAVLKLSLRPGQRCRQRLLPNYFMAYC